VAGFQGILAAGLAAIRQATSVPVAYRRGAVSVPLLATVGRTEFRGDGLADAGGRVVGRVETRDYLVLATDLDSLAEGIFEPRPGDRVEEATGRGTTATYEVVSTFGEPCWRWADPGRTELRIHTVATDEV
jgi:hypothetical protein